MDWGWVVVVLIIVGLTVYANPHIFQEIKDNVGDSLNKLNIKNEEQGDPLIIKCMDSFNECKYISTSKWDISIYLIEYKKFMDREDAEEFFNKWRGFQVDLEAELTMLRYSSDIKERFPLVLFATKIQNQQDITLPLVIICDKSGELVDSSKDQILC